MPESRHHEPTSPSPAELEPIDITQPKRRVPLHTKILIGLVLGAGLGILAHLWFTVDTPPGVVSPQDLDANGVDDRLDWVALNVADPLGKVFLRLVLMVVLPLVFSALALGVVGLGDVARLGRIGLRTLGYTCVLSLTAVALGILLVNTIQPGHKLSAETREALREQYAAGAAVALERAERAKPLKDTLLDMIPENPLQEMVGAVDGSSKGNGMLAVMFFSLIFGVALSSLGARGKPMIDWLDTLFEISMTIIGFAMRLAPFGVACLMFSITARLGGGIFVTLFWFVLTVLLGLGIHLFISYPLALWLATRRSPGKFFRDISEAMITAFGTSSSNATLPTALRVAEEKLKLPPEISRFVLTVGATANQNGTALFEGVVVLFLAQVFNIELTIGQQIIVVLMSVLAGIGTAGVPGGSIPLIVIVLQSVGIPGESIALILGIDRVLDMCRTVLNVTGDLVLATCVTGKPGTAPPG